jgi:hypothetical protein
MITGFPDFEPTTPAGLARFLARVREVLETLMGVRGDKMNKAVTLGDLIDMGIITKDDIR